MVHPVNGGVLVEVWICIINARVSSKWWRPMKGENVVDEIRQYKSLILLILKSVWRSNDVNMWKGLYIFIKHYV